MSVPIVADLGRTPRTLGGEAARLRALFAGAGIENPAGDAEVILCRALGWDRARLRARPEAELPGDAAAWAAEAADRRRRREPLAYILGEREFWSLSFRVTPDVLIPRPETELLVERAVALLGERPAPRVLDLGTGSGAVGVALAHALPASRVAATDVREEILALAGENARRNAVADRFAAVLSDLYGGLGEEEVFDAVVSNPPYVRSGDIAGLMPEVAAYEPRLALDGGPDGMRCLRGVIRGAPDRLRPGGVLLLEMDPAQIPACAAEVRRTRAFGEPAVRRDLAGRERVLEAARV